VASSLCPAGGSETARRAYKQQQRLNTRPEELILEVTESAMIDNTSDAQQILEKISETNEIESMREEATEILSRVED
jgi:EAL domain-containing protein (putative c-di-GMP-specific phosphodiesterase class I)